MDESPNRRAVAGYFARLPAAEGNRLWGLWPGPAEIAGGQVRQRRVDARTKAAGPEQIEDKPG